MPTKLNAAIKELRAERARVSSDMAFWQQQSPNEARASAALMAEISNKRLEALRADLVEIDRAIARLAHS